MKNMRALIVLLVAALAAVGAVVFAARWLVAQPSASTTKVVVATTDINLGQRLNPELLKVVDWPAGSLPAGAFSDVRKLDGRVMKAGVERDEPILESKLAPRGATGGLSAVIAPGKRAITVRVNDVIGVAGFALPGNYVDIIVSTQKNGNKSDADQNISKTVLEKILVLAVAQEVSRDDTKPKVVNAVTLEVTPEEAEKLDLARSVGTLSLVLRNQIDPAPVITTGATKDSLLGQPVATTAALAPNPAARVRPRPAPDRTPRHDNCVGVIDGTTAAQECF